MLSFVTKIFSVVYSFTTLSTLWYYHAQKNPPVSRDTWDLNYDYIVVGAGSAGSAVAARLSEDLRTRVLLLEAGGSENTISDIPQTTLVIQDTVMDWRYKTVSQYPRACLGLKGYKSMWPRGKMLGGSSALNYMLYIRGNRQDFDDWAASGATGWSYSEVLPYFIRSEDNQDLDIVSNGYHGVHGPLTVKRSKFHSPLAHAFLEAGGLMGYSIVDPNGPTQTGFQLPQATIRRGARCSSAKAFLSEARGRKNLHVITYAMVTRILFNQNREAIGVEFDRFGDKRNRVFAHREVIISAGSINAPQLLMLSGIGPREHLESLGIPVLSNLPVGLNLQDHIFSMGAHFITDDAPPNEIWTYLQHRVTNLPNLAKYLFYDGGPIASIGALDAQAFVRTPLANASVVDLPDIQLIFVAGCPSADDGRHFKDRLGLSDKVYEGAFKPFVRKECFSILPIMLKPKSRGYIQLRSRDPYDKPLIEPRYLSHPDDIEILAEGLFISHQLGTSAPFIKKFNTKATWLPIPGCEQYPMYSRSYMKCCARTVTETLFHPVGTCKMGALNDPTTVVDSQLRMKGVRRLRVADCSVMPTITSGNTNAPAIMIGEKAADLIRF